MDDPIFRGETWRPVEGSEKYEVSDRGRVRWTDGRIKNPSLTRDGLLVVNLYEQGVARVRHVHSIVAEAFHGPRPASHMVAYADGDSTNCCAGNLHYVPLALREPRRSSEKGRYLPGKLTSEKAAAIRSRAQRGESTSALAAEYSVSTALVSNIKHGKKWKKGV